MLYESLSGDQGRASFSINPQSLKEMSGNDRKTEKGEEVLLGIDLKIRIQRVWPEMTRRAWLAGEYYRCRINRRPRATAPKRDKLNSIFSN